MISVSQVDRFRWEDFPFQTPMEIMWKVIVAEGNLEAQWAVIVDFIQSSSWWYSVEKQRLTEYIRSKLSAGWRLQSV